ncbi:S1-like domain-containing RNA-binding protein [Alkalihalobacillus sp. MEB130]|uniref:CvfB family protein n=1 Tax=Alkalihalobacillus sp. MEB130 TaxID=2976704 RepID=UPI0028DFB516|nr:S1-like domain-containing RNA-binding protein [Alkalihalobacillus sp. MEB130]MDT8861436.1 S1-like domain-containing RNA-binding protein [Alkalihalobacillus sp. MEB130]
MSLKPGFTVSLEVVRTANFGFFLSDGQTDILLHEREATREIKVGDRVDVFLYHDHQGRLAATMEQPYLQVGEVAWLEAVEVKTGHGVFFHNGISRDLFLSMDELPYDREMWPRPGDKLPLSLTWDKRGRLMAKLVKGEPVEKTSIQAPKEMMNKEVTGYVYHFLDEGALLLTDEGYIAFLHNDEMQRTPRYGEHLQVRVQFVRDDGRINVTMNPLRSEQQEEDADRIYSFLLERGGSMPYWDKTPPEDIELRFSISKAKFKRALGKLMKENKIEQRDGWTHVKK